MSGVHQLSQVRYSVDWFGTPPQAEASGLTSGLAVAFWRLDDAALREFRALPMPDTHFICAHLSGSIGWEAEIGSRRYRKPCLPGTFNLLRPGEAGICQLWDANASFVHFYLPKAWLMDCARTLTPGTIGEIELLDPMNGMGPEVVRCAALAARALRNSGSAARLEIESAALLLAASLLRKHSSLAGSSLRARNVGGLASWQVRRACEAMASALEVESPELGLVELSALFGLGPDHFSRAFTLSTGLSPHRWQSDLRIERAKALLANPLLSLTEVAQAVGYGSQSAFGRSFARKTGIAPSVWRDQTR